jgi:RNA methyltransferase, TrmH family
MEPGYDQAVERVRAARRDDSQAVLEGVHALKHALRFGAQVSLVITPSRDRLAALLTDLAPDVALPATTIEVDEAGWVAVTGGSAPPSPSVALAARPDVDAAHVLDTSGRVVVLEGPRHAGNLGAAIRVAAAADAGGVLVVGGIDPWHSACLRGAAGLHFALPVARVEALGRIRRPMVAFDPGGTPLRAGAVADDALLAFGSERHGLTPALLERADQTLAIPMRAGVSSLNLATAVAVALYAT